MASPSPSPYMLRRANLGDAEQMAYLAAESYRFSNFAEFLAPHRFEHWSDHVYSYYERYRMRVMQPNTIGYVVVPRDKPSRVMALAVFAREGKDERARALRKRQWNFMGWLRLCWYRVVERFWRAVWTNPADNKKNMMRLIGDHEDFQKRVWSRYPERWHVQSVCVAPQAQRMGLGQMLMAKVLEMAQEEKVPVALESSNNGEGMYRKIGFKLLEPFKLKIDPGGGLMLWEPHP